MISEKYDLIYFIGDSYTFAVDQNDDLNKEITKKNRFSNLIGEHYNLPIINNAVAGCSNHYIFRKTYSDIYNLMAEKKKVLAIVSYTNYVRLEMFSNKLNEPITISETFSYFKDYMIESFNGDYCIELTQTYMLAIQTLFDKFNIDYIETFTSDDRKENNIITGNRCLPKTLVEIARPDGLFIKNGHANMLGHRRIADTIIEKIDELYGTR